MFDRSRIREISIPVGILVLVLMLFPAAHGSFVSTHGPVTALRSLRSATAILFAIAMVHVLLLIRAAATRRLAFVRAESARDAVGPDRERTCSLLC